MKNNQASPPRWAEATLRSLLRPSDRESIPGDLLEEYREVRHPVLGPFRAGAWYVKHVLSVLWRLIWPWAIAMAALSVASLAVIRNPWNISVAPVPRVSLWDFVIFAWAGFHASRRTGLIRTGALSGGVISLLGYIVAFTSFAIEFPSLLRAPFAQPFIFVILAIMLAMALAFGIAAGSVGGMAGKWRKRVTMESCPPTS